MGEKGKGLGETMATKGVARLQPAAAAKQQTKKEEQQQQQQRGAPGG